jgi:hypothetical protein
VKTPRFVHRWKFVEHEVSMTTMHKGLYPYQIGSENKAYTIDFMESVHVQLAYKAGELVDRLY